MEYGHALEGILRKTFHTNPAHRPIHLNKTYLTDGFYCLDLNTYDSHKLGIVFPTNPGTNPMVDSPLVFPMVWNNSPSVFSTATEIITNLANQRLIGPEYQPPTTTSTRWPPKYPLLN